MDRVSVVGAREWTGSAELPPALRSWGAAFSALTPGVMAALMPMLHRLDELFSRHGDVESVTGEPAGLAGLTTRGTPERLLISEWLLAEEVPEEFLRRAASRELLHLDTAYRHVPPAGTTRVVVDVGPAQAGAARLVQLAALVVLHRRARTRGTGLELGVLGEPVDTWHTGELPELLRTWLTARRAHDPTPAEVHARHDVADRAWFLLAPELATRLHGGSPPGRRVLTAGEAEWDDFGVVAAKVVLAGECVHLPLPPHPIGLRVLRGEGFRRASSDGGAHTGGAAPLLRNAGFSGTSRKLVGRGTDDGEVVTADVGSGPGRARVRAHRFRGVVVAASATGPRLIVLHQHGAVVEVAVVGKRLGDWHGHTLPREVLGLSSADLAEIVGGPPPPVHHAGGSLWVRLPSGWHLIGPSSDVVPAVSTVVVTPTGPDSVTLAMRQPSVGLWTHNGRLERVAADAPVVAGAGWVAAEADSGCWLLVGPRGARHELPVPPGTEPVGLVALSGVPHLVVRSAAGLLVRLTGPDGTRTLTGLSGAAQRVSVHPTMPILARDLADGCVEVHDLLGGTRLGVFSGNLG